MEKITAENVNVKIDFINENRQLRDFDTIEETKVIAGTKIINTDLNNIVDEFAFNSETGVLYASDEWDLPKSGSQILKEHFACLDQLAQDCQDNLICKTCGNVCVSSCISGCYSGCSGCNGCSGCGKKCQNGCGSCSGTACWGCGGGCTGCDGCNGCSSCRGCTGSCSGNCATGCRTICTGSCDLSCAENCSNSARLGSIG